MHAFKKSLEIIEKEVTKMNEKGTLSPTELENLKKAAEAVEVIQCILQNDEEEHEGYSERRGGNRSYRGSYMNYDQSYERGGNMRSSRMMPMDRSYDRGMSRADSIQRSIDVLESMLDTAETEKERRAIMNHIEDLKR